MLKIYAAFLALGLTLFGSTNASTNDYVCNSCNGTHIPTSTTFEGYEVNLSHNFIKMGGGFVPLGKGSSFGPFFGIGRRFICQNNALEISFNWIGSQSNWHASFPKVLYINYLNSFENEGLYWGLGGSYGETKNHHRRFRGIQAEFAIGYEFARFERLRPFIELDVTQNVLPVSGKHHKSSPILSLTCGVGF